MTKTRFMYLLSMASLLAYFVSFFVQPLGINGGGGLFG